MKKIYASDKDRKRAWYRKHRLKSKKCPELGCENIVRSTKPCEKHFFKSEQGKKYERARKSLVRNVGLKFRQLGKETKEVLIKCEM